MKTSREFLKVIQKNAYQIITSVILPFLFLSPYLKVFGRGNERLYYFFLDELSLYVPQTMHSYNAFKHFIFSGVDFLTANGSSQFFLRPNLITAYPLHYLSFLFSNICSLESFFSLIIIVEFLHMVPAMFFSQLIAVKYLKFDKIQALFLAVFFVFSSKTLFAKPFPPFMYIVLLIPLLVYTGLISLKNQSKVSLFFLSGVYILGFLSGYIPLAAAGILVSVIFAALYHIFIENNGSIKKSLNGLFMLFVPIAIAFIVIFPFYTAIMSYNKIASTVVADLRNVVRHLSLTPSDIFTALSYGLRCIANNGMGTLYVGLIPVVILVASAFNTAKKHLIQEIDKRMLYICLGIFGSALLISFGLYIGVSDMFYTLAPGLGDMHVYSRYLLITNLFFSIFMVIIINYFLSLRLIKFAKISLIVSLALTAFFIVRIYLNYMGLARPLLYIDLNDVIFELVMFAVFLAAYIKLDKKFVLYVLIGITFILNTTFAYKTFGSNEANKKDFIFLHDDEVSGMLEFIKTNSGKVLPKYLNCVNEVHSYVPRNFPWLIEKRFKLSNYYGYELHLASERGYRNICPFYGNINFEWAMLTGCDFIIINNEAENKYKQALAGNINEKIKFSFRNGDRMYKTIKKGIVNNFPKGGYFFRFTCSADRDGIIRLIIGGKNYDISIGRAVKVVDLSVTIENDSDTFDINLQSNGIKNIMIKNVFLGEYADKWIPIKKIDFDSNYSNIESLPDGWRRYLTGNSGKISVYKVPSIGPIEEKNFDNGIIKILGEENTNSVKNFYTNYSNKVKFDTDNNKSLTALYQLYPASIMKVYVDGKRIKYNLENRLAVFEIPAGKHKVKIVYRNYKLSIFNVIFGLYLLTYILLALYIIITRYIYKKQR
ncbi:MAG: hypothetical protein ABH857_05165 [Elusimicrobiota bacterium]